MADGSSETLPRVGGSSEYEVIPLRPSWGAASLTVFVIALLFRPVLFRFVWRYLWNHHGYYPGPVEIALSVPILAGFGVILAWLGLRFSKSKTVARLALFLNGAVLIITVLMATVFLVARFG